ncbi:MAG: hypothetical protein GY781_04820 [Gammaproteobacteria bacterium]|nr:hypothetical protein [Gammaproteobacteria bacterium]
MTVKNAASVCNSTDKQCNESDIQKDSVKTAVRTDKSGNYEQLKIAVSIVEDMFPDYCEGKIERADILEKLMADAGLTENDASKYFNDIQKQILQGEL